MKRLFKIMSLFVVLSVVFDVFIILVLLFMNGSPAGETLLVAGISPYLVLLVGPIWSAITTVLFASETKMVKRDFIDVYSLAGIAGLLIGLGLLAIGGMDPILAFKFGFFLASGFASLPIVFLSDISKRKEFFPAIVFFSLFFSVSHGLSFGFIPCLGFLSVYGLICLCIYGVITAPEFFSKMLKWY